MLDLAATGLVAVGAVLLVMALVPAGQIIRELPGGTARRHWHVLAALIYVFVAAYVAYLVAAAAERTSLGDLIVPGAFFLAGYFVRLVTMVSLLTARDVRRVAALEEQSVTDPLMSIYNRRHLDRRLEEEIGKAKRYGIPLSALLLDVDHFKSVNDQLGHAVGDRVLRALGQLVLDAARSSDIITRYGGEEVLILAPHTALPDACLLADRLRRTVEARPIPGADDAANERLPIKVTVSIGVAALGPEVTDAATLLKAADDALYRAKHAGRNRVEVAPVRLQAA